MAKKYKWIKVEEHVYDRLKRVMLKNETFGKAIKRLTLVNRKSRNIIKLMDIAIEKNISFDELMDKIYQFLSN